MFRSTGASSDSTICRSKPASWLCRWKKIVRPPGVDCVKVTLSWRSTGNRLAASTTLDRKSTRLNSSHRCISYAVFCLKKKNNNNIVDDKKTMAHAKQIFGHHVHIGVEDRETDIQLMNYSRHFIPTMPTGSSNSTCCMG